MTTTQSVLVATAAILISYDFYAGIRFGLNQTISADLKTLAQRWPVIPLLFGILMGHFFWSQN